MDAVLDHIEALKDAIEKFVLQPENHDLLSIVKAARNGAVYGSKVRFPHALVMILLFRNGTIREKLKLIFTATKTHARNLATFAALYQTGMTMLKHARASRKESPIDAFLAGLIGGYFVFGRASPRTGRVSSVSQQIVIYVCARVLLALAKLSVKPGAGPAALTRHEDLVHVLRAGAWPVFASVSWAMVMYLFRWHPEELQGSLRSSMVYIYKQANTWDSLRNFIWHNVRVI
ncbi:hypothetical protein TD95_004833 [Thielaviopsis punctulata]|uniref:Peroxisomal membrane protein 4 n=1 Tax=Thielaviopsis punctulata TaxID=72032 RepID=A0A0F4Z8F0_9PEZI|nr:hypothetical protein TD95_004833 [Thielaviopsis punctulata]